MKKLFYVLVLVAVVSVVGGCGKKEETSVKSKTAEIKNNEQTTEVTTESIKKEEVTTEEETTEKITEAPTTEVQTTEIPTTKKVEEITKKKEEAVHNEFKTYRYYPAWKAPEGFFSTDGMVYTTNNYPEKTSNITYQYQHQAITDVFNENFYIGFDGPQYEWSLEEQFYNMYGFWVDIKTVKDETIAVEGGDRREISMEYMLGETSIKQTQYIYALNSHSDIFYITYTLVNDEEFDNLFADNFKSIKMGKIDYSESNYFLYPFDLEKIK